MTATIQLRHRLFTRHAEHAGHASHASLAAAMHVDRSTVTRVLSGSQAVGASFVAGALIAFPELTFSDLFQIQT